MHCRIFFQSGFPDKALLPFKGEAVTVYPLGRDAPLDEIRVVLPVCDLPQGVPCSVLQRLLAVLLVEHLEP